jgi:hypothetical protein
VAGATASFQFSGTSVTWIGARSEDGGFALVSVDGGPARQVDLFVRPQEIRTPVVTLHDLSPGQHTLTIQVTGGLVVVDAFDVEAPIVSHKQENDPDVVYTGTWIPPDLTNADPCAGNPDPACVSDPQEDHSGNWSGGDVQSAPEPPRGGAASAGIKIVVDAFDVTTPGRRFQEDDLDPKTGLPATTYTGTWTRNVNRAWSEGAVQRGDVPGSIATFTFTGTGVSYIGCQKNSIGPVKIRVDGVDKGQINNFLKSPREAYAHAIFSIDGLTPGPHTLEVESVSTNTFIVVDAFDVRGGP